MNLPSTAGAMAAASMPSRSRNALGVLGPVDAGRFELDRLEPGLGQLVPILRLLEGPGHASDPQLDAAPDRGRHLAAHDDVGDREAPARLEHAKGFGEHPVLVGGQVDHAVRDDDVDRAVQQRSEERRVGKSVDLGGRRIMKKKKMKQKKNRQTTKQKNTQPPTSEKASE